MGPLTPGDSPGGSPLSSFHAQQRKKEKEKTNLLSHTFQICKHNQQKKIYICSLSCQKALALSWETVRAGASVNGQECIKLISCWMVSGVLKCSINPGLIMVDKVYLQTSNTHPVLGWIWSLCRRHRDSPAACELRFIFPHPPAPILLFSLYYFEMKTP